MRADAQRNRDRILQAARAIVAETGVEATMEEIARHAGVAVGTLYRHFPAKEELVAAVVEDSVAQMAVLTEGAVAAVHAGAAPGPALLGLFREFAERHGTDQAFKAASGRLDVETEIADAPAGSTVARAVGAISELLDRAQVAGEIRDDIGLADLVLMLSSVPGLDVPVPLRRRFVEILVAGLAP